jgi:hypothetical protein
MQLPWVSILILILLVHFTKAKKFSVAAYLYTLPFFGDLLNFEIGPVSIPLWTAYSLLIVLTARKSEISSNHKKLISSVTKPLMLFLVISIAVFTFVGPMFLFNDFPQGDERAWSQQYVGRATVSSIRFLLQIVSIYATCIVFSRIAPKDPIDIFSLVGLTAVTYGFLNLLSHGFLNSILFPSSRLELSYRLVGMNGEPRVFGQSMAIIALIFLAHFLEKNYRQSLNYFLLFSGAVIVSLSATSISVLLGGIFFILASKSSFKNTNKLLQLATISIFILPVIFYNYSYFDPVTYEQFSMKLERVLTGKENDKMDNIVGAAGTKGDAFDVFKRLEVFDRAAMNFMAYNPMFLLTGVGPNTVSIPSSSYIDAYGQQTFGDRIDSVPHSGLINAFTWSGLIGLFIIFMFYLKLFRLTNGNNYLSDLSKATLVIFTLINPPLLWLLIGYIVFTAHPKEIT